MRTSPHSHNQHSECSVPTVSPYRFERIVWGHPSPASFKHQPQRQLVPETATINQAHLPKEQNSNLHWHRRLRINLQKTPTTNRNPGSSSSRMKDATLEMLLCSSLTSFSSGPPSASSLEKPRRLCISSCRPRFEVVRSLREILKAALLGPQGVFAVQFLHFLVVR
jgi:hypothetical protein